MYQLAVALLLLSAAALMSAMSARNENPWPAMFDDAIVGQVLIDGRGADGVTVSLDAGAPTETRTGGLFRFDGVEAGTHTVTISNYPAHASFGRTAATAIIANDGDGPATVNFFGSYLRSSPNNGAVSQERRLAGAR
ncbi:carboxypeptidase-like regulatory domain-containing protein [Candidatus Palauibacter sp.]|uniref:carboxypeptidase-like regulatory domain-containing protein n=1 Tax=Candidatus Palauibacter sp. TaxID=3101350 RepID=UPI003B0201B8